MTGASGPRSRSLGHQATNCPCPGVSPWSLQTWVDLFSEHTDFFFFPPKTPEAWPICSVADFFLFMKM